MATLSLLCGLPGSGKTTFSRQLESAWALRLNSDDWMVPLFGQHMSRADFDARFTAVRALQWDLAARLLGSGMDVVLDDGFWKRAEREHYRAQASAVGAEFQLIYFDVSLPELRSRLAQRNRDLPPGTFEVDEAALALFSCQFEPPAADEHPISPASANA